MMLEGWDGRSVLHGAAHLIAARELRFPQPTGPWSIAELELSDADFEKLLAWARREDGPSVKRLIERTDVFTLPAPCAHSMLPGDAIAGLLLLALCAECTARLGSSDAPWRAIVSALGDCSLRRALFSEGGVALSPLKDAFRAAASRLWMRSGDLHDPGQNRWYQLLLLQGGVPRGDSGLLSSRLTTPEGRTFLVGALQQQVPSFRAAWSALERLRDSQCTRDYAERAVRACPFFRPPYAEILEAAGRSIRHGAHTEEPEAGVSVLLAGLQLQWPSDAAAPCVDVVPAFTADEEFGHRVELSIDGVRKATYKRRADGRLMRFGASALRVPLAHRWVVSASSTDGEAEAFVEVALLEEDAILTCFDREGARCGAGTQAVRYIVAREPLLAVPPQRTAWLPVTGLAVSEVDARTVVTTCEGLQVWPPSVGQVIEASAQALEIMAWHTGAEPGTLTVRLGHSPAVAIRSIRVGSAAFEVRREEDADGVIGTTAHGVVPASAAHPELRLTVYAVHEGRGFQRTLRIRAFTAAALDGVWLDPTSTVELAKLAAGALGVCLGPEFKGRDARLSAGGATTEVDVAARGALRFTRAPGYGEPLLLCGQEPWSNGPRQVLAARVEHRGNTISHEERDGSLRLVHRLDLEDVTDHWMLVWPRRGAPAALPIEAVVADGDGSAVVVARCAQRGVRAVALCYGGAVLGASWTDDWSADLVDAGLEVPTLVNLIRLLSLPVLAAPHLGPVVHSLSALGVAGATVACTQHRAELQIGDAGHALRSSQHERWSLAGRAILLELRLSALAELRTLEDGMHGRFPPFQLRPDAHGVVTPEQQAQLAEHNRTHPYWLREYDALLLRAGAVHPRDAVVLTPHARRRRDELARRLADASRNLNPEAFAARADGARPLPQRVRDARLRTKRLQLGVTEATIKPTLAAVEDWVGDRLPPLELLREALLNETMAVRIQLELLDRLAFPATT